MKANRRPVASAEIQLYLRIKHPALHPDEITDTLKLQPEEVRAAGATTTQNGIRRLHSESYWIAELPVSTLTDLVDTVRSAQRSVTSFNQKAADDLQYYLKHTSNDPALLLAVSLATLFSRLETQQGFLQRIIKGGGSITLLIQRTLSSEALSLSPAMLAKLAALGMSIEIN